jgi:hypothetical protein
MAIRIMRDSASPAAIPLGGLDVAGGYVNGLYAWKESDWDRFGKLPQMRINVDATPNRGNCLDVERFDATPDHAPGWWDSVTWCSRSDLWVYCSWSSLVAVIQNMGSRPFRLWLASPQRRGPLHGVGAVQNTGANNGYDESVMFDTFWPA